jgi:capsule biosynthesis phosphatase
MILRVGVNKIVIDLDGTLTLGDSKNYKEVSPNLEVIETLKQYKEKGYQIVVFTARNMRTYENNVGKINIFTLPTITAWLDKYSVPYDEIYVGKPWCGEDGFYVDDRAIRPSEFSGKSMEEIESIINKEKLCSS